MNYYKPPYQHYNFIDRIEPFSPEEMTALDLGCGSYVSEVAKQVCSIPFKTLTSVEGYKKDFDEIDRQKFECKEHVKVLSDVVEFLKKDKHKYDIVFMFDVIEHLTKEDGLWVLNKLDKIAKRVVIFVPDEPDGFHRVWEDGNVLQNHISYWRENEFTDRGYKVERIVNGHSDIQEGKQIYFDALWAIK